MKLVEQFEHSQIEFDHVTKEKAAESLESGKVIYFPSLSFSLRKEEQSLLSPDLVKAGAKNISFNCGRDCLKGAEGSSATLNSLQEMMKRYASYADELIQNLFPDYKGQYEVGKTSYRVVEVKGRPSSYRKDDTRLHVDAFPSNPNHGKRILRVFCNVNPNNQSRHWRLGESFDKVAEKFLPAISAPIPGASNLLRWLGMTKHKRSDYDYYMNKIHNRMKADENYQKEVTQQEFYFPPHATWLVFTDQASHAALAGQYVLEQTFYLPIEALRYPKLAPLKVLESKLNRQLVAA